MQNSSIDVILEEIRNWMQQRQIMSVSFISRVYNGFAHCLGKYASNYDEGGNWTCNFPEWLCSEIERDAIISNPILGFSSN